MKNSELIKLLKKSGCNIVRHGKRHDIWFSPISCRYIIVPRHKKEVASGTASAILSDAGIDNIQNFYKKGD